MYITDGQVDFITENGIVRSEVPCTLLQFGYRDLYFVDRGEVIRFEGASANTAQVNIKVPLFSHVPDAQRDEVDGRAALRPRHRGAHTDISGGAEVHVRLPEAAV